MTNYGALTFEVFEENEQQIQASSGGSRFANKFNDGETTFFPLFPADKEGNLCPPIGRDVRGWNPFNNKDENYVVFPALITSMKVPAPNDKGVIKGVSPTAIGNFAGASEEKQQRAKDGGFKHEVQYIRVSHTLYKEIMALVKDMFMPFEGEAREYPFQFDWVTGDFKIVKDEDIFPLKVRRTGQGKDTKYSVAHDVHRTTKAYAMSVTKALPPFETIDEFVEKLEATAREQKNGGMPSQSEGSNNDFADAGAPTASSTSPFGLHN